MPSSLVDRATSDLLIGPDWSMNVEICDSINQDPALAKDVVKGLKKRIWHKNPKVQLLALTLLETIIKNCGDIVHMYVAEKDLPHEMAKIAKKKPDFSVKEKILVLIDTWQDAFGGPRARYPQYYAAYQELLRAEAVFPRRPRSAAPMFTLNKNSVPSHPQSSQSSNYQQEPSKTSAGSDFPTLSLAEIQNARGVMDVLSEMLNALDPGNKEGLGQEVILDLVRQCRSYKQRLVHLVNTSSDEDLLCQGLGLNDDLQHVLSKHDALTAGVAVRMEKTKSLQALVDIDDPAITKSNGTTQSDQSGRATSLPNTGSHVDLLSGDFDTPAAEIPLALVPVSEAPAGSATEQNALVLSDVFSQSTNNNGNNSSTSPFNSLSEIPTAQAYPSSPQPTHYSDGSNSNLGVTQFQQLGYQGVPHNNANPGWNGQAVQGMHLQHQQLGAEDQGLPLPPWETQSIESSQVGNLQTQPSIYSLPMHGQLPGPYSQQIQDGQPTAYDGYVQQYQTPAYPSYPSTNEISQGMYGLSMQDYNSYPNQGPSYQMPTSSYVQQLNKLAKPEDKLFGDLVSMAKTKPNKTASGDGGNV